MSAGPLNRRKRLGSYVIADEDLYRPLREIVSVMMSIPEQDRLAYFRGWDRIRRQPHSFRGAFYSIPKVAGKARGLGEILWPDWPPQEEES